MDLKEFAVKVLRNACPSEELPDGSMRIWIETHCVGYWANVIFDPEGIKDPIIVSIEQEDC